jgi:ABC-2 type transport system permease protein
MVPVFAMPALMQRISAGSPLAWGLDAFLTIWVRGGSLADAWPGIGKLLVFAVACLIGAWGLFYRRIGRGS